MSFALTTKQIRARTKTVTRRLGWKNLKPGTLVQPVVKGMGLKKGETVEKIGGPVRILSVRRELLSLMIDDRQYGDGEAKREGFPTFCGEDFVFMFCEHNKCNDDTDVSRIEFEYVEADSAQRSPR